MSNLFKALPYLLIISAFGPYLLPSFGLRVEHLVIYSLVVLFVFYFMLRKDNTLIKPLFNLFFIWSFAFLLIMLTTFFKKQSSMIALMPEIENFIQPIALLLFFIPVFKYLTIEESEKRLTKVSKLIVTLVTINSFWALMSFFIDTTPINEYFWGGTETTASKAEQMGRYSGIFTSPAEGGIMNAIGLFAWIYYVNNTKLKLRSIFALMLIILGGLITVSKFFILVGLPLAILVILFGGISKWKLFKVMVPSFILGAIGLKILENNWNGQDYFLRLFNFTSQTNLIDLFTGGRYGSNSQQSQLFEKVLQSDPILGTGFGYHPIVDSGFFHFFGNGGAVGLVLYILILISLVSFNIRYLYLYRINSETVLFTLLTVLIISSSFGIPILVVNRVSIVIWVLLGLLIHHFYFLALKNKNKETIAA